LVKVMLKHNTLRALMGRSIMYRFENKNALITGASSGIGQACAARFVSEGATVVGLGRSSDGLSETERMVEDPTRFHPHYVDLVDDQSIIDAAQAAGERLDGRVD